ncbi:hypothetical protein BE20_27185 [Sorangium cellulosum]|nr:hypothetical protein BE20_27185 [Sorangium cellulosum]
MHDVKEIEGTTHEFKLVSLLHWVDTVKIEKWLVSPGDEVAKDQPLVEVVTDLIGLAFGPTHIGATLPAPRAGKILLTRGQEGETVSLPSVLVAYAVDRGEPAAIDDRSTADHIVAMVRSLAELTRRRDEAAVADRKNEHIIAVCLSDHDQKRDELLRRFGKAALEPLLKLLTEEPLGHVRFEAATLVRELRSHAAIPELVRALADARDDVRATARDTLGGFDPRHVRAALLRALADGSAAVRCAAVAALARLGDAAIVHEIERRLDDEDAAVRHAAALALVEFHPENAGDALSRLQSDPDEAHRSDAVALVARLAAGPDALERLAPWAGDPSPAVRGQVYAALAGHRREHVAEVGRDPRPPARRPDPRAHADALGPRRGRRGCRPPGRRSGARPCARPRALAQRALPRAQPASLRRARRHRRRRRRAARRRARRRRSGGAPGGRGGAGAVRRRGGRGRPARRARRPCARGPGERGGLPRRARRRQGRRAADPRAG